MVVVERHEVAEGFSNELAALSEKVEIHHEFVFGEALSDHVEDHPHYVPEPLPGSCRLHFWIFAS